MGNSESNQNITTSLKNSPYFNFLAKLFENNCTSRDGLKIVTSSGFDKLFIGPNTQLSNLLYKYFIAAAENQNSLGKEMQKFAFISGFDILLKLEFGSQDMIGHYFKIFSEGRKGLSLQDLIKLLLTVQSVQSDNLTLVLPHEDKGLGRPDMNTTSGSIKSIEALSKSLVGKGETVHEDAFVKQVLRLCPRLFCNVHWWVLRSLSKLEGSNQITHHCKRCPKIQLISDTGPADNLVDETALWILSISISSIFMKHKQASNKEQDEYSNCQWRRLYNSNEHGLSYNRFKHHCFSYRGPNVMVVLLANGTTLLLTLDTEWRESSKCFGDSNTQLYQLYPEFKLLAEKTMVLYNEKSRGLPVGLTLGNNPSQPVVSLVEGLTVAKVNYSGMNEEESVQRIEVWGCAGYQAELKQKQQQKWERRQAEQIQKVKLPGKWDENPDKALLDMAGITTEHAQR